MDSLSQLRVMGPGGNSDVCEIMNLNSAPKFMTNETTKIRYRDYMRRWIKIIGEVYEKDDKYKGLFAAAGSLVY